MASKSFCWNTQIEFVVKELKKLYDYDVIQMTDEPDRAEFEDRLVFLNSRSHPETRFYTLLHEYGHVELFESHVEEFTASIPCDQYYSRSKRSQASRVSSVAEEIEAWKRGRQLAHRSDLKLNRVKYNKQMTDALMTYIRWAAE